MIFMLCCRYLQTKKKKVCQVVWFHCKPAWRHTNKGKYQQNYFYKNRWKQLKFMQNTDNKIEPYNCFQLLKDYWIDSLTVNSYLLILAHSLLFIFEKGNFCSQRNRTNRHRNTWDQWCIDSQYWNKDTLQKASNCWWGYSRNNLSAIPFCWECTNYQVRRYRWSSCFRTVHSSTSRVTSTS